MVDITLHSAATSANIWRNLLANGGYQVYADADGSLHGIHMDAIILGEGFVR